MKTVAFPPFTHEKPLIFYLALEEFLARNATEDVFFLWRVDPTVICGRHQVMAAEVNLDFCAGHGVNVFRRKSGGGAVYSDKGNIMVSYITTSDNVPFTFDRYLQQLVASLRSLGLDATASGRNDILIGGRKVSGNAFYKVGNRNIIHGTLLFNSDFSMMMHALTPSHGKIQSKGIASVRQRVANLSEFLSIDIQNFISHIQSFFTDGEMTLSEADWAEVARIQASYLDEDFLKGHEPGHVLTTRGRIPGVGELIISCEVKAGKLRRLDIRGDFFALCDDPGAALTAALLSLPQLPASPLPQFPSAASDLPRPHAGSGIDFTRNAIASAIPENLPGKLIRNLTKEDILNLIFD